LHRQFRRRTGGRGPLDFGYPPLACSDVVDDLTTSQFPVDACGTVGHGVSHDTTSAQLFSRGAEADLNWLSRFAYYYNEYRFAARRPPDGPVPFVIPALTGAFGCGFVLGLCVARVIMRR
jgi:hypothetical protein